MDWLRRNWPDLLIGLALIAVIAGIVSTLLTGGSFFPSDGPAGVSPSTSSTSTTAGADEGSASAATSASGVSADGSAPVATPSSPPSGGATAASSSSAVGAPPGAPDPTVVTSPTSDEAAVTTASAPTVVVTPLAPGDAVSTSGSNASGSPGAASGATSTTTTPPTTTRSTATRSTATATPSPSSSGASASASLPAAGASGPTEPFRISVGAFSVRENAERQAARFRSDGYPVFFGTQGTLTLVLVGPYTSESEALRVARAIASANVDVEPVVYEYRPEGGRADATVVTSPSSGAEPATSSSTSPAAPAADSPTPAVTRNDVPSTTSTSSTDTATTTPAQGVSYQVGAFSTSEAARGLVSALSTLGFAATEVREAGLIKIVVGPFEGQAASDARTILEGAGIEFFARP